MEKKRPAHRIPKQEFHIDSQKEDEFLNLIAEIIVNLIMEEEMEECNKSSTSILNEKNPYLPR